jgi:cell division protein FtsB
MTRPKRSSGPEGFFRGHPPGAALARRTLCFCLGAFLIVLLVLSQLGENGLVSWFRLRDRQQDLQKEVATYENNIAELERRLEAIRNDPAALEKLAREKHNMRRPDEEVLTVLPAPREEE